MKFGTVLPTALATAAVALGVGAVAALAQDKDRRRPAPQEDHGDHDPMMGGGDGAMTRSMDRHHAEMMGQVRDIDPDMARMMDRHHQEMMGQMHKGAMGGMGHE